MKKTAKPELVGSEELLFGRRPVLEALRCGNLQRIYLAEGLKGGIIEQITRETKRLGLPLKVVPRDELNRMARGGNHQGIAAAALPFRYLDLGELLEQVKSVSSIPFIMILDHLQDPQNLGSLLRTADAAGMHGIIIPEDRSVKITPVVRKVAAGAAERLPVARVVNLADAIGRLKNEGFWIYGADAKGKMPYYQVDYRCSFGLVLGSEGKGLSRLLRERCDGLISIPVRERAGSLNAAVAAAVIIYAAAAQREGWTAGPAKK